jgi:acetylglutamate kinase
VLNILLENKYTPVVSPVSLGKDGKDYNINADMFAGHLAAALAVDHYVVLTDVDGLRSDPKDSESLISELSVSEMISMRGGAIQGGMIPKTESIEIALNGGASNAIILNGQKAEQLNAYFLNETRAGTKISKV